MDRGRFGAVLLLVVLACSACAPEAVVAVVPSAAPIATATPTPTASPTPEPTPSPTPCSNPIQLATWDDSRLAMQTIAVPVSEVAPGAALEEVSAGAGGLILFGSAAPSNLGSQLA